MEILGWALRMRWLWLKKTQPDRPWAGLDVQVHPNSVAMFSTSVISIVGGHRTLFWCDKWMHGKSLTDLAPSFCRYVPKKTLNQRTVHTTLMDNSWVRDIRGGLTTEALLNTCNYGRSYLRWSSLLEWKTSIFGNHLLLVNSRLSQHTGDFLWGLLILNHGRIFGKLGPLLAVGISFGWLH